MFSGLIEYNATMVSCDALAHGGARLCVRAQGVGEQAPRAMDSIAIDGVCLTATVVDAETIAFDVVPETLDRSTLGALRPGAVVNLEYSLRVGDRLGGHFVYGHVDATAAVWTVAAEGQGARMRVERPSHLASMLVEKAFVAVDGVSVTIAATGDGWFEVALIPETMARTTLGRRATGDRVNVEVDPLARYAAAAIGELLAERA
ncbi:MAG TPA: riboflavin synthase [Candidatus Baltobacteraceae bacterium]